MNSNHGVTYQKHTDMLAIDDALTVVRTLVKMQQSTNQSGQWHIEENTYEITSCVSKI